MDIDSVFEIAGQMEQYGDVPHYQHLMIEIIIVVMQLLPQKSSTAMKWWFIKSNPFTLVLKSEHFLNKQSSQQY